MPLSAIGLACAVASAVLNGSFMTLFRTPRMVALQVHPAVFQVYACLGIFVSSWLVVPFLYLNPRILVWQPDAGTELRWSVWGMLAGFLFVAAVSASFAAVRQIGMALAQGIWGGGAMVVSYAWGVLVFGQVPRHVGASLMGLFLLVVGVVGIAQSAAIGRYMRGALLKRSATSGDERLPLMSETLTAAAETTSGDEGIPPTEASGSTREEAETTREDETDSRSYMQGVLWALGVALTGGSILAPLHYVSPDKQGLVFLPSFGVGALLVSPVVLWVYLLTVDRVPPLHLQEALVPGMLSGLIWNLSNLLAIIAIPAISYGVAYPILQCALLISGLWGIYVFQEITDAATIVVFWVGGLVLVCGGALLAVAQ